MARFHAFIAIFFFLRYALSSLRLITRLLLLIDAAFRRHFRDY